MEIKLKHNCEKCNELAKKYYEWSEEFSERSKNYYEMSKDYSERSNKYHNKCKCKCGDLE